MTASANLKLAEITGLTIVSPVYKLLLDSRWKNDKERSKEDEV